MITEKSIATNGAFRIRLQRRDHWLIQDISKK